MPTDNRPTADQCLRKSPLDKTVKVVNTINTGYLGQCKVIQDTTNTRYLLLKEMVYNGEEEFVNAVMFIQMQKAIRDEGLLYIIDYSTEKVNNFCSSFYNLRVYLLPHLEELRNLSKEREKTKEGLTEKEMTYMLFHLTHGLSELHKAGLTHKQLSPESVDTTNLVGRNPKLIYLEDGSTSNVKQVTYNNIFKSKDLFVAPEIYEKAANLVKGATNLNFDEQKLDAFSLGMTLLYAGCGHSIQDSYDTKTYKFNKPKLDAHIAEFKSKYAINPMITEAVEKLVDLDPSTRISVLTLQSELPRLEEINQYFEVTGDDNMQGDYNEKFPITVEDKRAGENAKAYLTSKNRLFQPGNAPMQGYTPAPNQGAAQPPAGPNQGAAPQQGFFPGQPNAQKPPQQGFFPGQPNAQNQPQQGPQQQGNFGAQGPTGQNNYSQPNWQAPPQGNNQYQGLPPPLPIFDSQMNDPKQQNRAGQVSTNPLGQSSLGQVNAIRQQPQNGQSPLNVQFQGGQPLANSGVQSQNQGSNQRPPSSNKNPLMNFNYPGTNNQGAQPVQSSQQPNGQNVQQVPLSTYKPLSIRNPGLNNGATQPAANQNQQPLNNSVLNGADPSKQSFDSTGKPPLTSNRPAAPVMANHSIFGRPPQSPAPLVSSPPPSLLAPISSSLQSGMKRSSSQPVRIGTAPHQQSESTLQTVPQTTTVYQQPGFSSRPISYSQSNLHSPLITGPRISENTYGRTYNPMVVSGPQVSQVSQANYSSTGGLSGSRIRSSSHNIIRNGVVVDVNNPVQELRASRIVVTGDKVDYFMDENVQTRAPVSTYHPPSLIQAAPLVSTAPQVTSYTNYSRPAPVYTTGTPIRTSNHVGPVHYTPLYQPASVVSAQQYISAPRVYNAGTPVRYGGYPVASYASSTRVVPPTTSGVVYGPMGGSYTNMTPRKVVQNTGPTYATPRTVQKYSSGAIPLQETRNYVREELTTPRNEGQMIESKYLAEQVGRTATQQHAPQATQATSKREDSDIKPRELDSGEGDHGRIHYGDGLDKAEPNWTDN
jgi:hypothetical protein